MCVGLVDTGVLFASSIRMHMSVSSACVSLQCVCVVCVWLCVVDFSDRQEKLSVAKHPGTLDRQRTYLGLRVAAK